MMPYFSSRLTWPNIPLPTIQVKTDLLSPPFLTGQQTMDKKLYASIGYKGDILVIFLLTLIAPIVHFAHATFSET
jgi:hypothetical protein